MFSFFWRVAHSSSPLSPRVSQRSRQRGGSFARTPATAEGEITGRSRLSRAQHKLRPWQSREFIRDDLAERNHGRRQRKRNNARISSPTIGTRSVTIAARTLQIDSNEPEEKRPGGSGHGGHASPRTNKVPLRRDLRALNLSPEKWRFNRD